MQPSLLKRLGQRPSKYTILWLVLIVVLLGSFWLLPIDGQVLILTDPQQAYLGVWPYVSVEPPAARPGEQVMLSIRDTTPWSDVKLLIDGRAAARDLDYPIGSGPWHWRWRFALPGQASVAVFYHTCQQGCVERTRVALGSSSPAQPITQMSIPTKLGLVFADPSRDWHGRAGWTVELAYARQPDDVDFGVDGLASRVHQATKQGLRPLVRIAYDRRQTLPPAGDEQALRSFLDYCSRVARDARLSTVYGYIIGSGFNTLNEHSQAPERLTTPEWYARVFNGYDTSPTHSDNVVQVMRSANPHVRILVGPVAPWVADQNGTIRDPLHLPWLNYMNTLLAHIDAASRARQRAGIVLAGPDGFAVQARGRLDAPEIAGQSAREPVLDLHRPEWGNAQAGFRVYRDWLAIINRYPSTRGLPVYITATNTWGGDDNITPAQNYAVGWLTTAFMEINREPQVQALCWFVDLSLGGMWDEFSLSRKQGAMRHAAEEFDRLLQE